MKKILKYLITLSLIFVMVFAAGSFCSCKEDPANGPGHESGKTEPDNSVKEYSLHNWYATIGVGLPGITLTEENYSTFTFPVPQREHYTFNGWYIGDDKVADEYGKSLMTERIFNGDDRKITAKFTANETFTYRILLVFVTQIDAELLNRDSSATIRVQYEISDLEKEFYELTVPNLKQAMDDMMDGLVDFQIDGYFTTRTVLTEYFERVKSIDAITSSYILPPYRIPEVQDMLKNYDTCLTVYSTDDYDFRLHDAYGSAHARYGEVNLDSRLTIYSPMNKDKSEMMQRLAEDVDVLKTRNKKEIEKSKYYVNGWFKTIIHETAHTIEQRINCYEFHKAAGAVDFNMKVPETEAQWYYYKKTAIADDINVGIPYGFWKGEVGNIRYNVTETESGSAGIISSKHLGTTTSLGGGGRIFEVVYGESITVTAQPFSKYRFVRWSDGVETAERTDYITGDFEVTAIFEEI